MILSWFTSRKPVPPSALQKPVGVATGESEAVTALRRAFAQDPSALAVCDALAAALLDAGDRPGARAVFEHVASIAAQHAGAHNNLGVFLRDSGELPAALASLKLAVQIDPRMAQAWENLAATHFEMGELEPAIAAYKRLLALPGATAWAQLALGNALMAAGDVSAACQYYRQAIKQDPECANARWALAMAQIRPFYDHADQVEASRVAFAKAITELDAWFTPQRASLGVQAVGSTQPFYLAYHARNNLPLLQPYGALCARLLQPGDGLAPQPAASALTGRKLRVGFASAQVRNHSVWIAIAKGWIQHLDTSRFEVHVFHLGRHSDAETAFARAEATDFVDAPRTPLQWSRTIADAQLDVLIYPEIGMDSLTTQLAAQRLAPLQATAWGHPHTSGLPTMDMFLSAEYLEPPAGDSHYCEKLIRLPHLGVCVAPLMPTVVAPDLTALGLPADEPLLLCPGVPFKYRPEHDAVWAALALRLRAHGAGRLVFFGSHRSEFNKGLEQRLRRAFRAVGADFDAQVCVITALPREQFYGLMQRATLMLDTIAFSGFNTALQGLECGLPVIAHEGEFMRGRLASGLLRCMGLNEWVAQSDAEFVDKAMQLVENEALQRAVRQRILASHDLLFHDLGPVRALEQVLTDAIQAQHKGKNG